MGNRPGVLEGVSKSPAPSLCHLLGCLSCAVFKHSVFSKFKAAPLGTMCPFNDIFLLDYVLNLFLYKRCSFEMPPI